ncbi:unnamed protein product [Lepeophtheirus salmonis]|uniref:(salmon louse) hypothetical protein n=1 Tax=Lepeophtheirus salmonis TaxID=72036 RepID=A0A7R8D6Q7_LEPSM|nr:unnamed protein product [Lepeophtheirus salmonis]CAF3046500.1 unnamed protein product [Lepeophtheirus salmonis]
MAETAINCFIDSLPNNWRFNEGRFKLFTVIGAALTNYQRHLLPQNIGSYAQHPIDVCQGGDRGTVFDKLVHPSLSLKQVLEVGVKGNNDIIMGFPDVNDLSDGNSDKTDEEAIEDSDRLSRLLLQAPAHIEQDVDEMEENIPSNSKKNARRRWRKDYRECLVSQSVITLPPSNSPTMMLEVAALRVEFSRSCPTNFPDGA